jgi:glycosyltransferase involved in cell wall biosynthesis
MFSFPASSLTVSVLGTDDLPLLMAKAKAFIFPGLEDFGITPVQAEAAGRPVIAYKGGGALDTVLAGVTGAYFDEQSVDSLAAVMQTFDAASYDPLTIRNHALKFDTEIFKQQIQAFVQQAWAAHQSQQSFVWHDPTQQTER